MANFYPAIASRISQWAYANTQSRIHVLACHAFLRSLVKHDLARSRVGRFAASVDELVADLLAHSHDALLVGDGAVRYHDRIVEGFRCELADESHPSAGWLVQLAHSRALREEWSQPAEIQPLYLRPPDAEINWTTRAGVAGA